MQESDAQISPWKNPEQAAGHNGVESNPTPRPLLKFADFCEFAETVDRLPKPEPE